MNYTKPEVSTVGDAATVIEKINNSKAPTPVVEPQPHPTAAPAYDLDE